MISTVKIKRATTAEVVVEHPDEWSDDQVSAAVKNRAIDVAAGASMWSGDSRTEIAGTEVGTDFRDGMDDDSFKPEPVQLTAEDLDGDAEAEDEPETEDEEPAEDEPAADDAVGAE